MVDYLDWTFTLFTPFTHFTQFTLFPLLPHLPLYPFTSFTLLPCLPFYPFYPFYLIYLVYSFFGGGGKKNFTTLRPMSKIPILLTPPPKCFFNPKVGSADRFQKKKFCFDKNFLKKKFLPKTKPKVSRYGGGHPYFYSN